MSTPTEDRTMPATEWARKHGEHFVFSTPLDNYEPSPRSWASGEGWIYRRTVQTGRVAMEGIVLADVSDIRDAHNATYLIDDGRSVVPYYVAAWHPEGTYLILHKFPTNFDDDGNPVMRADRSAPVNYDNWVVGPRRAYHLKIRMAKGDS